MMCYKNFFRAVLLVLFSLSFAEAANAGIVTDTWRKLLDKRSSMIFTESVDIGGLRVGGRGKIMFTWLDRSLISELNKDRENVDDSVLNGLEYYFTKNKEITKLMKKRDVFLLSYQAIKRWDFKIEEIVINGYRLTTDDILTAPHYRVLGEIPPVKMQEKLSSIISTEDYGFDVSDFQLYVAVPSMPKRGTVKISYGEDTVEWEIPRR